MEKNRSVFCFLKPIQSRGVPWDAATPPSTKRECIFL
jgi:hypothetical protein